MGVARSQGAKGFAVALGRREGLQDGGGSKSSEAEGTADHVTLLLLLWFASPVFDRTSSPLGLLPYTY